MNKTVLFTLATILLCVILNPLHAQTEAEIKRSELPEPIKTELNKKYVKYTITLILKKVSETKEITFVVEVQKKNTVHTMVYDNTGELIDKTKSKNYTFDGSEPVKGNGPVSPPSPHF